MAKTVTLTKTDFERLKALVSADPAPSDQDRDSLRDLRRELDRAVIVESDHIESDIVTMNSRVRIRDLDTGDENEYALVYPLAADISHGRISVLAPLGTALIGYRKGDVVEWRVPSGVRRFKIAEVVFQPEASGDFSS